MLCLRPQAGFLSPKEEKGSLKELHSPRVVLIKGEQPKRYDAINNRSTNNTGEIMNWNVISIKYPSRASQGDLSLGHGLTMQTPTISSVFKDGIIPVLITGICALFCSGRALAAGTWRTLAHPAPEAINTMLLLSDGSVMAAGGGTM